MGQWFVPAADTVTLSFPQPLVISPGGSNWCLTIDFGAGQMIATATGYYY